MLLNCAMEKEVVWGRGSLNLKAGILRLQRWSPGFDPYKEKTSTTQVWTRFYRLPWELWDPQILIDIVRNIGIPLLIDRATLEGDYSHFTRVLIDVDLANPL